MLLIKRFVFIKLLLFYVWAGLCLGLKVHQSPTDFIPELDNKVQIFCSHEKTDYWTMLWYQRSPGDTALKLIGYIYLVDVKMEESYTKDFEISGDLSGNTAKNSSLIIKAVEREHSALYYCAAREAQWHNSPLNYTKTQHNLSSLLTETE